MSIFAKHSIPAWIISEKIKVESGKEYDLRDHLFWFDVLRDWHPEQVWFKAAQTGGSIAANLKLLWAVKNKQINSIYTLPTAHDVKDFVRGKTNMLISENQCLRDWVTDVDSIEQKQIGTNVVYFRGTSTERAALSISSDLNIHDEVDRSNQEIVEQYASRQNHSKLQWKWYFSNPSTEGTGVDRYWQQSDMKHWFITCGGCGKKQYLSWPDSIDVEAKQYICKHCKKVLTDEERRVGSWHKAITQTVPRFSGYWINLMMCPWVPASKIVEYSLDKTPEYFFNFVLGLPYVGIGNKLTENEFFANLDSSPYATEHPVVIGVDTGLPNWYVIGNRHGLFSSGSCNGYDELEMLLKRFPKAIMVIDQGGDLIGSRKLREDYPGRVFLCYYRADRKTMRLVEWGKDAESGKVIADRNRVIQLVMDEWRSRRLPLRGTREEWFETWTHVANEYRTVEPDLVGNERFVWQRYVGKPDHLLHAICYWRIGMSYWGQNDGTSASSGVAYEDFARQSYKIIGEEGVSLKDMSQKQAKPVDWRDV